ncbi:MAG: hypothetical protein ACRD1K_07545 [Acidimicrobiales bacterium]
MTGLRRGELLGLRWADVDLDHGALEVVQQLATVGGRPVMKQLKTESSDRVLAIGPRTVGVLRVHHTDQAAEFSVLGLAADDAELVFTSEIGGWIDPNNVGRTTHRPVDRPSGGRRRQGDAGASRPCRHRHHAQHLHAHHLRSAPARRRPHRRGVRVTRWDRQPASSCSTSLGTSSVAITHTCCGSTR